jgi:small subunit ribosomal protein S1
MSDFVEEEDFAALLEASLGGAEKLNKGQSVDATVVKISGDWVFIDTGRKGEGVLSREEFLKEDGTISISEGDTIRAIYLGQIDGETRFTTRIGARGGQGNAQIEEAWRSAIPVEGSVEKEVKGGFEVRLPGAVRAFCPFSQIDLYRGEAAGYIGRRCDFRVIQYSEDGRNIVVSRRIIMEEEAQKQKELLRESLSVGMVVTGTIRSLLPFGAFINVGGIDGLIPISELAWGRVADPAEILTVGQVVQVTVKKLDWENNKFSFSLRDAGSDPWQGISERYPEGSFHVGTVARLVPFGAFVTLEPGIDGLIHISKLGAGKRIAHPKEAVREGEKLEVKIEAIDLASRKISLALATVSRAAEEAAESVDEFRQLAAKTEKTSFGSFGDLLKKAGKKK